MTNFWENIIKYPKFFVVSLTGLVLTILSPFFSILKKATYRSVYVAIAILFFIFVYISLSNMIEIN